MKNETGSMPLLAFVYRLETIILPVLIVFGSIFNIVTFIVMRRKRMRVSSTCFYMAALAVTDTLVLWTGCLNQWFYLIHIPTIVTQSNLTCKLLTFLLVLFADASVWIIVCMSFERYFAVSRPLRAVQMCTTKRARSVLLTMFIVFALIDGHFLLTLELTADNPQQPICHPKESAQLFVLKIFVYIDALKYSAVPFCILIILSILIIRKVFHAEGISAQLQNLRQLNNYRQCSTISSASCTTHSQSFGLNSIIGHVMPSSTRVGRRVTLMLLSVSIAFCIFSSPMSLMQIVQSIMEPGYHETPLAIGKAIAELCQYFNHSCNFFLYALTGRIFRREFVRLFLPTRFGDRKSLHVRTGINGNAVNLRTGPLPNLISSSSRHGSYCSAENNRFDRNVFRLSRRSTAFYPAQFKDDGEQSCGRNVMRISSKANQNLLAEHQLNDNNNNPSTVEIKPVYTKKLSLNRFWSRFERRHVPVNKNNSFFFFRS